jgi:peptidoglycan-associated lipoprotein
MFNLQETVMSIRILFFVLLSLSFYGCSSTEEVQDDATVVDQGTAMGEDADSQTYGATEAGSYDMSALDDPNSPLATRIIYFEYDSSDIRPEFRSTVEAHGAFMAANPNVVVTLEGHADERGSREYNLALGERRAESVRRQMAILGASGSQFRVVSYGEERPAIDGHDEYAWSQNRRVEIIYR